MILLLYLLYLVSLVIFFTKHAKKHLLIRYFDWTRRVNYHIEADDDHCFTGSLNHAIPNPQRGFPFDCSPDLSIAGCVNGVLCLFNDFLIVKHSRNLRYKRTVITLWNPSIRKYLRLPETKVLPGSTVPEDPNDYRTACGFGYDPKSDDYRVVKMVSYDFPGFKTRRTVEVYSLQLGSWRLLEVDPGPITIKMEDYCCNALCIDGKIHWVGSRQSPPNLKFVILQFDLCTETFHDIGLNGIVHAMESTPNLYSNLYLVEYKGSLALFKTNYGSVYTTCTAWRLIENGVHKSWQQLLHLNMGLTKPHGMMRAFAFTNSGNVLMVRNCEVGSPNHPRRQHIVFSVDVATNDMTILREIPTVGNHSVYLSTFVQSIVLFNKGKIVYGVHFNKEDKEKVIIEKVVVKEGKCIITVEGLENFGVKLADASKKLGKKFSTGASVVMVW